jgi:hypothetical protein
MSGFQSPNYTQTPNDFFDMLPDMLETELRVTLVMIRQTFGFHRDAFKLGVQKLADAAGLSRQGALDGAQAAEKRGTFRRTNQDAITEAEWELAINDPSTQLGTPLHTVEGTPLTGRGQVRVKERIKKNKQGDKSPLSEQEKNQANAKVDAIIEGSFKHTFQGRETFRPDHYALVDWYNAATGQECPKSKQKDWHKAVGAWAGAGLTPDDLQAAYDVDIVWRKVFTSPNELTEKAIALKAQKRVQFQSQRPEHKRIEKKEEKHVPNPFNKRDILEKIADTLSAGDGFVAEG